ncbi:MAG: malto-oligosyltrehalose synthase, partial [Flavisolibacter sp.]
MNNLTSTYRIQFHKDFNFDALQKALTYLESLGIGTLYASPIFEAVPGSTHGYDGLNPHRVNPEVGPAQQLTEISLRLSDKNISWLQDIVPNHMAFDHRNPWLMDVLEKGPQSSFAKFFDIAWTSQLYRGRVMVPFLGNKLEDVIRNGELKVAFEGDRFVFQYYDACYPIQPLSYSDILSANQSSMPDAIEQLLSQLPKAEDEKTYGAQWDEIKAQLSGLQKNEVVHQYIHHCLQKVNDDHQLLKKIESQQSYRLCHWQETDTQINYRRFFTVNGLICLNIQDSKVFDSYHRFIKDCIDNGIFQGLRVDHIDGLYDPTQYLERLREMAGEDIPVVVEKILEPGESLPAHWPVQGNTGYDFLSLVNNLLTNQNAEGAFTRFYRQVTKNKESIHEQLRDKKSYILYNHMAGELENLYQLFRESNLAEKRSFASVRPDELKETIGEFLIQCPVYRYYASSFPLGEAEASAVANILDRVRRSNSHLRRAVDILVNVFLKKPLEGHEEVNQKIAHFYQRCMQFTGPLMAKGVEDTLMYTYQRFIGHNEVGDSPESFGMSIDAFHQAMIERQNKWPLSLNATSTHDTKRGEDVRARLNVLTDLPEEWLNQVKEWQKLNAQGKIDAPDANDEYFIYQTIAGAFPMPGEDEDNFANRLDEYLQKALREAKTHSNWTTPNEAYESAAKTFARNLLDPNNPFRQSFDEFQKKIVDHGIVNSLAQVVLKFTCPGIPDVYQGCELWDLSLVDPDNRRPVDYEKRSAWLQEIENHADLERLWKERFSGKIKLWIVHHLFQLRQQQPDLFSSGEYIPLKTEGIYKDHVIAFARRSRQTIIVVAVPLHAAIICKEQGTDIKSIDWKDTIIQLPDGASAEWQHLLIDATDTHKKNFSAAHLFKKIPVAILKSQRVVNERGAGILAHISSLPSPFGIGDMGPEAKAFADFLSRSRQKYWQLLPLNPIEAGQGHSPYSSISSRAGNILFISPEV